MIPEPDWPNPKFRPPVAAPDVDDMRVKKETESVPLALRLQAAVILSTLLAVITPAGIVQIFKFVSDVLPVVVTGVDAVNWQRMVTPCKYQVELPLF